MKKSAIFLFTIALSAMLSTTMQAQRHIQLDLLGANGLVGVSFNSRMCKQSKFGYSIGLGYGFMQKEGASTIRLSPTVFSPSLGNGSYNLFSLPISAYYLLGKDQHFFQIGGGLRFLYTDAYLSSWDKIGYFTYSRLAYRFEGNKIPLTCSAGAEMAFYGNLSFGITPVLSIGYRL